jgi:hypothetical protein
MTAARLVRLADLALLAVLFAAPGTRVKKAADLQVKHWAEYE